MNKTNENIIVEIEAQIKNQEKENLIETWTPISNGNLFLDYLKSKDEISDKDKITLEEDTIY